MNTNSKRLTIYTVAMLVCTAIAVTLRTVACITELKGGTGYFEQGSLTTISNPLILITVLFSLSYIFTASKIELRPSFSTPANYVPTGILGVSTLFLGARIMSNLISTNSRYAFLSAAVFTNPSAILSIIAFVLSLVSVGYFFFNVYSTEQNTAKRAGFAIGLIGFLAIYAMLIYFDSSLPLNNPGKVVNQMAFLSAAVFFLYETRISLGREMWRVYSAFTLAAAALTAYSSLPALITYYVNGHVIFATQKGAFISLEEYMLTFAIFIYALAKLVIIITTKEESEDEYAKAISAYASAREAEVDDSFRRFQEDFASKQLSIFELYGDDDIPVVEDEPEEAEEAPAEEEKAVMISDDAIYEAIFGKMPEKDAESVTEEQEKSSDTEEEKDTESIVEDLLTALEKSKETKPATDKDED